MERDKADPKCPSSIDGLHLMVRRRDGVRCVDCGAIEFMRDLTDEEMSRLKQQFKPNSHLGAVDA